MTNPQQSAFSSSPATAAFGAPRHEPLVAGRFELLSRLGLGSFGEVYRAHDHERRTDVALKRLWQLTPDAIRCFKNEFRARQDLEHPNLVHLSELIEADGEWFLTMELVVGEELSRWALGGARKLVQALAQIVHGLAALHAEGFVHRDVKPSNIRVTPEGRAVLLDFGFVTGRADLSWVDETAELGTAVYMAPERTVGPASDFYAVGVILYEALTGRAPFEGAAAQLRLQKLTNAPALPSQLAPNVSPTLDALTMALLARDPSRRPDASEILAQLAAELGESPLAAQPAHAHVRPPFVGREHELALLRRALRDPSGPRHVHVEGDSGLGKSTLVWRFLEEHEAPALVLRSRCFEREVVPYNAFDGIIDALGQYLGALPRHELTALLPARANLLGQLFPVLRRVLRQPTDDLLPDRRTARDYAFEALIALFSRLAERKPLILAIDDLQWADDESLEILPRLFALHGAHPFLITTARPASVCRPRLARLLSDIFEAGAAIRLELNPFQEAERIELTRQLGAGSMDSETVERIARESLGHPFFIGELVRFAAENRGSHGRLSLDEVIAQRVERIDAPSRALLELTALSPGPLSQQVLADAARQDFTECRRRLLVLRHGKLVRTDVVEGLHRVEPFHDRVRQAVATRLAATARKEAHQRLANALRRDGAQGSEALAHHLLSTGQNEEAALELTKAAVHAERALAFDRAARLYREALAIDVPRAASAEARLQRDLAFALANAGRSLEAARAFLRAAHDDAQADYLVLRRLAAQHLLQSGHIREGIALLKELLSAARVGWPETEGEALRSLLWARTRLWLRGSAPCVAGGAPSPLALERADLLFSLGKTLRMFDALRGAMFHAIATREALALGDPRCVARALLLEVSDRAARSGRLGPRSEDLYEAALQLVTRLDDPSLHGLAKLVRAVSLEFSLRLDEALSCFDEAEVILRDHCSDVGWELTTNRFYSLAARIWRGDLGAVRGHLDAYLHDCVERQDLYGTVMLTNWSGIIPVLCDDAPDEADQLVTDTMSQWHQPGFQVQHFVEMWARTQIGLYRGGPEACAQIEPRFAEFVAAKFHFTAVLSAMARSFRAYALVEAARSERHERDARLAAAKREAKKLAKLEIYGASTYALITQAGIASVQGRADRAVTALRAALATTHALGFHWPRPGVEIALGRLLGGEEGAALIDAGRTRLRAQGVRNVDRFAAMLAPGFG